MSAATLDYAPPSPPPASWDEVDLPAGVVEAEAPTWLALRQGWLERTGPTWSCTTDGTFLLPERSLGYQGIRWSERYLRIRGEALRLTPEQKRFIVWRYAVDENGEWVFPGSACIQRVKGAGKDPLIAVIAAIEFIGPSRFSHFQEEAFDPRNGTLRGDPIAIPHPEAWVQIAAVTLTQTRTTMLMFQSLFSKECKQLYGIKVGKELIYARGGTVQIQAVTSNAAALEGARPTFMVGNETHQWRGSNGGFEMREVMQRNADKVAGRILYATNAYQMGEGSVGELIRTTFENEESGESFSTGMLYDSLEVSRRVGLAPIVPGNRLPTEGEVRAHLSAVIRAVAGGAWWLPIKGIVNGVLSRATAPSVSRRFWLNQIVADDEAWVDPGAVAAAISPQARAARTLVGSNILRAGWLVTPSEPAVMFGDMSKNNDTTGLIGCRISDGYVFTIGMWRKPPGQEGKTWKAPRGEVDARVEEAMERFNMQGFWADPSHTSDDDASMYWTPMFDEWHRRYRDKIDKKFWAVRGGQNTQGHAVLWDMASPQRSKEFGLAAEMFVSEMEERDDVDDFKPSFLIDGHPTLVEHLNNAKAVMNRWGNVTLMKTNRMSAQKIDLGVCAVGARMLRRLVLNAELAAPPVAAGRLWGEDYG